MDDALSCPVCLVPFDEGAHVPKLLRCGHTFCVTCVDKLRSTAPGPMNCPTCRQPTPPSSNLATNYVVLGLVTQQTQQAQRGAKRPAPLDRACHSHRAFCAMAYAVALAPVAFGPLPRSPLSYTSQCALCAARSRQGFGALAASASHVRRAQKTTCGAQDTLYPVSRRPQSMCARRNNSAIRAACHSALHVQSIISVTLSSSPLPLCSSAPRSMRCASSQ